MQPVEHRCEPCNKVIGTSRRSALAIGRPFVECPSCGGLVERAPYEEWALMRPHARASYLASKATLALALGLLPALFFGLFSIVRGAEASRGSLLALAATGLFITLAIWITRLSNAVRRSRSRLSDPMYRAKLAEFGMQTSRTAEAP